MSMSLLGGSLTDFDEEDYNIITCSLAISGISSILGAQRLFKDMVGKISC